MTIANTLLSPFLFGVPLQTAGLSERVGIIMLGVLIGTPLVLVGGGYLRLYNRLRKLDPVPIQRLTDPGSTLELSGTVEIHENTSLSPFTDTECIAHEWKVEEYKSAGTGEWSPIDSGQTRCSFQLDDGTGTVLVDPDSATLELTTREQIEVLPDESPPPAIDEYLAQTDRIDREDIQKRRYNEQRLELGDEIHLYGPVRRVGHSVDMPDGVDAIIGVDDSNQATSSRSPGLFEVVDRLKTNTMRFVITVGDEREAERHLLKRGLLIAGGGIILIFCAIVFAIGF